VGSHKVGSEGTCTLASLKVLDCVWGFTHTHTHTMCVWGVCVWCVCVYVGFFFVWGVCLCGRWAANVWLHVHLHG
jgi:hypothetical protein